MVVSRGLLVSDGKQRGDVSGGEEKCAKLEGLEGGEAMVHMFYMRLNCFQ